MQLCLKNDDYLISCSDGDPLVTKPGCSSLGVGHPLVLENAQNGQLSPNENSVDGIVFPINTSDDLDSTGSSTGKSNFSDLECIDSINSPDESDLQEADEGYGASLGDAVLVAFKSMDLSEENEGKTSSFSGKRLSSPPPLHIKIEPADEICADEGDTQKDPSKGSQKSLLDSPLFEDTEFQFNRTELRKSSSLKATKTPPGTPSRKKMVRFADAMGLDLESVRHVLNADAPPKIPASAIADLNVGLENDRKTMGSRYLTACFQQPGASENFLTNVMTQKVCLENAVITDLTITGVVRVANLGFHKTVRIRYSTNSWASFHDIMASYVQNSCDGPTDRFSFSIVAPQELCVGSRLEFAISYTVGDAVYWDNNSNANYCFECFAKTTPVETRDSWMHFI